jgi:glycosyltransferase involved in cell wall biosynthesis
MTMGIGLVMIVKDEEKRLKVSLDSILGVVSKLFIFDTGSTDKTVDILKTFSKKHNIPLVLKQGEFINFSVARNISIDMAEADETIDFLLLLDSNDELKNGKELVRILNHKSSSDIDGFMICQEWLHSLNTYDRYFNTRVIRTGKGWRYHGSVHEWIKPGTSDSKVGKLPDTIRLFQDRKYDAEKSMSRYTKDRELLLNDIKINPNDSRAYFYLAQTCSCLGLLEETYYYYKERSKIKEGFWEEVFHSYLRLGDVSKVMNHPWEEQLKWYMKALETSKRAEPLVKIADYYRINGDNMMSYYFVKIACEIELPECLLFVDRSVYDYKRWHTMGIVAYYCGKHKEGREACIKAIEARGYDIDKKNLSFYKKN